MATQSEYELETQLVEQLVGMHYEPVNVTDEASMKANLKKQIEIHNRLESVPLTDNEFNRIFLHLTKGNEVIDRARTLRDRYQLLREDGTEKWLSFINKEEWCQNEFQVTRQVKQFNAEQNSRKTRFDVTLLINGLPLVQIELKRRGLGLKEAFNQIDRYHRDAFWVGSGLFQYVQIFIISNGVDTKYYANNRANHFEQTYFWTDEKNEPIKALDKFAEAFLKVCHIAKMITHYTVLNETRKCLMVMRPYQYYACEAMIRHVKESLHLQGKPHNGYIWHTTGSGKTLTSFKASQVIMEMPEVDRVIFVVDRRDLDYQTAKEFNSFAKDSVDTTNNTSTLIKHLKTTSSKLTLTTIQKLNNAISPNFQHQLEHLRKERIVFIFDECHRSQFGDTHKAIVNFFENAQLFGFTGTPIFADNVNITNGIKQTTEMLFEKCLHKYVIVDAIRDENVLRFAVEYVGTYKRKESSNEIDIEVEDIDTKEVMESDIRLGKITDYILAHHNAKTRNREFTAMFCVGSVDMLIRYYKLFKDKQAAMLAENPEYKPLKVATIFTYAANEADKSDKEAVNGLLDEEDISLQQGAKIDTSSRDHLDSFIKDYNELYGTSYSANDSQSFYNYYKNIAQRTKEKGIDILLVVNMFLTGFDSPALNTLYVDKNLRFHGLVQGFSRTNRILNEKKSHGNIVCFRNLKKATDEAIALFSNKDASSVVLVKPFEEYLSDYQDAVDRLLTLAPTVESVDSLPDEKAQLEFVTAFRDVMRLKNILESFADFDDAAKPLSEQTLADYTSKYLDIHDKVKKHSTKEKVSILDDIDFEVSLIHRDEINVGYILKLLAGIQAMPPKEQQEQKKKIMDIVDSDVTLRSKRELIENFIEENLLHVTHDEDVTQTFETYVEREKSKAISVLCEEERLDAIKLTGLLENYIFTDVLPREDQVAETLTWQPKILERKTVRTRVYERVRGVIDTFIDGMRGF
ncbi:TPA: type I restriction endonuclease subunit R [Yersinia enterocolitica]|uniref:type I restriction endonuclease subunit R n=1 Tax=unclassified Citrobacter freundii complex TaxID=2816438 RepID=UPI000CD19F0E|nr:MULTISPECIES: type I restriction endonuclease subunit R [unclassified Citrobacter freundii complex]EKN3733235.1 type I restriction endonuclease subunit R [Yersinia enterocolitica]AUV25341.1 deoxyribonuclease HsdR [Citrobacter freundii complex sp. CFNIH3]EKN6168303.1 type I restriction endonuclease subunit R [Yersinia enterocolitica]EKN6398448.1 type I restriction endonuclease subunit R [Yersinia enterocolitica]EKN6411481.1 type I restriction endonuclease subunit R [Yersinia enterocolitica]